MNSWCTILRMSKKLMRRLFVALLNCLTFFGLGDAGTFHCEHWVVPVDPRLISSEDPQHERWVIQGLLTKILTEFDMVCFWTRPWQQRNSYPKYMCSLCIPEPFRITHWRYRQCPTTFIQKVPNFVNIFQGCVCGRPPRPIFVFQWSSVILEPFKTLAWPTASWPQACWIIWKITWFVPVLPSMMQNYSLP